VKTFSKSKSGNINIVPNFKIKEFACNDGTDTIKIDYELACILQKIREVAGKPITINSSYRTVSYNKKVGGASNSYHLYGRAADIKGVELDEITAIANSLGVKGIIKYPTFVHIDTRVSKYHATSKKEILNCGRYTIPYCGTVLKQGSKGYNVAIVQFKLAREGYDVGTVDGIAGSKFDKAVKAYQKNKGLLVDGKVGTSTWNKLFN
jgi:murein L,D-transpeptidase YcbB/YkuD